MLEKKTEGAIKYGQSKGTSNIGYMTNKIKNKTQKTKQKISRTQPKTLG
jgi:hypothetical protein